MQDGSGALKRSRCWKGISGDSHSITQISQHLISFFSSLSANQLALLLPQDSVRDCTQGLLNSNVTIPGWQMCQISKRRKLISATSVGCVLQSVGGVSLPKDWSVQMGAQESFQGKAERTEKIESCLPHLSNLKDEETNQSSGKIRNSP